MGPEKPFGKRETPPSDPRTAEVRAALSEYRQLTEAHNEELATVHDREQQRLHLETEMSDIEKDFEKIRVQNPSHELPLQVSVKNGEVSIAQEPGEQGSFSYAFAHIPEEVVEQFKDGSSMSLQEVETLLKTAMDVRGEAAQSLIENSKDLDEIVNKRDKLGKKNINPAV